MLRIRSDKSSLEWVNHVCRLTQLDTQKQHAEFTPKKTNTKAITRTIKRIPLARICRLPKFSRRILLQLSVQKWRKAFLHEVLALHGCFQFQLLTKKLLIKYYIKKNSDHYTIIHEIYLGRLHGPPRLLVERKETPI